MLLLLCRNCVLRSACKWQAGTNDGSNLSKGLCADCTGSKESARPFIHAQEFNMRQVCIFE